MSLSTILAENFNIPVISDEQKIWFFRTKAGQFYLDFQYNNFIALGWELVDPVLIKNQEVTLDSKKEEIIKLYPEEKRPGLILGQMDTFYNKMKIGDFVVIPSAGGKQIAVGRIGDFIENVVYHKPQDKKYSQCNFSHKRAVEWIKNIEAWQDIYLFKALRAQQTISDITEEAKLLCRNLFPVYISGEKIHCTLQKRTYADLSLADNIKIQYNLLQILNITADLYGMESVKEQVALKTAVGSPGFIEMILPCIPISIITVGIVVKLVSGKIKSIDGVTATGISALISTVNTLFNDYHNRKKTDAEVKQIEATARLIDAQAEKERAEAEKIRADAEKTKADAEKTKAEAAQILGQSQRKYEQIKIMPSGKTDIQEREEQENLNMPRPEKSEKAIYAYVDCGKKICEAASNSGITFGGKSIDKIK